MATVKSVSFTCPSCAKVLRASAKPPAGKKIKCPSCEHSFVPELDDDDDSATRIQAKPSAKAKAVSRRSADDDDDDEKPRNKKSRADDDDDDKPRKKSKQEDDEEDEDDDDRSIKKKPAKKKKSGSMMMIVGGLVFLGGGALVSCVLCGVGAFVWPGFLKSKGGNAELAAFVGPDANMVMGASPKQMKAKMANLERMLRDQGGMMGQGNQKELEDVSLNADKMLAFGNTKDLEAKMMVVFLSNATDIQKIKRNPDLGAAQTIGGHANVHKQGDAAKLKGWPRFVAFPSGNIVVTTDADEATLIAALTRGKEGAKPNATLELGKSVDKSPFWLAVTPDADTLNKMRQEMDAGGAMMPPGLKNAAPAIAGIKGMTLAFDIDEKSDIKMNAAIVCKNADDAGKLKTGVDDAWTMLKGILNLGAMVQQPGQPQLPPTFLQDINSITFATQGANVTANMKLQAKTIEDLAKMGAQQKFGGGPFVPPPKVDPFPKNDGFPKIDPFPKNDGFPKFDGKPKFDGGPKIGKGKLISSFIEPNLLQNQKRTRNFQFQQGKRITVTMTSFGAPGIDIDVFVFRGNENFAFISDTTIGPNGSVTFVVPANDSYRIEVQNVGIGNATSTSVTIREQ